ncbi:TPA: helix-turn-helix transcriptional regulator [Streptococcus agalactiae]|uniref:DNA-binding helix-turn-helix protein n=1 Tax=Streptococcus urinalis 2285-97 TaxID=764291 RepID=G5KEG0_9STRE|nr:helix-turn-helix transcriptional regulator [Streptococcus urinalis]QBX22118.1 transcriptional regulation [Streptococcus phage Javan637]QBX31574.1 transcriptional regulation [Streptococcus phage Javan642]QBX31681.1 transcriptional regulation [Streptococcus phage Javan648]HEN5964520.1 helix-turn-helix transcriptional regulator [Streptococcus agalactiae]EHJ56140.1 DNA-binding helix-turn-helix protein [Streptococcus urinalis 2285-97]
MQQISLRALRVNYNLSAKEVAKTLEIHYQTLLKYENDSSKIPHDLLKKLADFYNVDTNYIFLGKKYELIQN